MEPQSLSGKTALVTGSARRVGAAIVNELHRLGAHVVIHYRNSAEDALALQQSLLQVRPDSASTVQGDLLDDSCHARLIAAAIAATGRLDILVNNASNYYPTLIGGVTAAHWDDLMGINARAPFFLAQAAAPLLRVHHGCIVNLVDIHATRPNKDFTVYSMAKAANAMMVKALARELAPEIRVNGVAPGAILWPEAEDGDYDASSVLERIPLGRAGDPVDIAHTVAFLARSGYITGHIIPVDGGRTTQQ